MSSDRLSEIFDDCVTRLAAGATVEQCLRDYPADVDQLLPLLETVTLMRRALPPTREVIAAQDRVRATMLGAAQSVNGASRRRNAPRRWIGALAAAVLIFALFGGLGYAAEGALPGDTLYPVKLLSEAARMSVTHDPALAALFGQRRIDETKTVLAEGRQVRVSFTAPIDGIDGSRWQVGGIPVDVSATTRMPASVQPGDEVTVEGVTATGIVRADEIERQTSNPTTVTPAPPTPVPSATPAVGLTIVPPQGEVSVPPTATPTPEGACTPTAPAGWVSYSVRAGDTASRLAASTSITLDTLMTVNCLTNASLLSIGQVLYLPSTPPTLVPRATQAQQGQPASGSDDHGGESHDSGGVQSGGSGGSDNSGSGSSNSGSDDSGSGGSDHSGSGSSNSGSGSGGSGGSDDNSGSGSGGSDDGGSSGHGGGGSDDGGGHGSDDD